MRTARWAAKGAALALGGVLLAGCGSEGVSTNCRVDSCTVTFDRGVEASVNVLGVDATLVGVDGNQATIEVAGEQIALWTDEPATEVAGLAVRLERVNDREVVVRIGRN